MKMPLVLAALLLVALSTPTIAAVTTFGSGVNQFAMEFVTVGNPGNVSDNTGAPSPAGSVAYSYDMGKFEVSRDMVTKANSAGGLGLSLGDLSPYGGNGVNKPATGISWYEAARFVNWLNTSQGYSPAYKFTTQPGNVGYNKNEVNSLWVSGDVGYNAANPYRNGGARYVLPTVNEWYKAAFFNPTTGTYFDYPTGSNVAPTPVASGTSAGTAVFNGQVGPADINVAGGLSPYGVMAMGGNAFEWEETESDLVNNNATANRGIRSGDWSNVASVLLSTTRIPFSPADENPYVGFRVAAVPEASPLLFGAIVAAAIVSWRELFHPQ